jgi:DNA-binding GntR family transcriptional regulator
MTLTPPQPDDPDLKTGVASDVPRSRAAWLAEILRERIISGTYPPGERIRENALQKEFGFSNGPVREALQIVVGAGLAERAPWQGVRVVALNEREILELFQLRAALMQYVVELAARHGSDEILAQANTVKINLRKQFQTAAASGQPLAFTGQFSAWLLAAAGNATISQLWENTLSRAQIYVNAAMRASEGHQTALIVNELIDAVAARDVRSAVRLAKRLSRQTLASLGIEGPI